ncbi:uncharacterized protein LOC112905750 isoform X2 [Agrilus planipennis]|uniref:Uncharacterized protein LOC112905750 isoform X2 n=1 Tax=Agrilus planipennis TaxID=224129 RepID=A0A7F5RF41_AGRPL|nr:uncharacterized protein LOC112905750 isoform X2 [Agrilus planipennis]
MLQDFQTAMGPGKQVRLRRIRPAARAISEPPKGILKNTVTSTPKSVTLRRPKDVGIVTKTKKIQENLKTLEKNTEKKRIAQALYYGEPGQSPLTRTTVITNQEIKKPVHARLGKKVRLYRAPLIFNNNRIIKSKNRFQRSNTGVRRLFSVQGRIQKIREQQILQRQNMVDGQQIVSTRPSNKIRLQRTRPITPLKPTNLTVQVTNNKNSPRFDTSSSGIARHNPLGCLNPKLQAEIKFLQRSCGVRAPLNIPCEPIYVEGVGYTGVSLHERFSLL